MTENEISLFKNKVVELIALLINLQNTSHVDTTNGWRVVKIAIFFITSDKEEAALITSDLIKQKTFTGLNFTVNTTMKQMYLQIAPNKQLVNIL
mgnify:CR=1 FL=1